MKVYPLIALLTLLFWGWRSEMIGVGLVMGVLLEVSPVVRFRLHFKKLEYNRVSDLCTLFFIGSFFYLYSTGNSGQVFEKVITLLPLILFPLMLAQVYGKKEKIDYRSLFIIFRRKSPDYDTLCQKDPEFIKEKRNFEIEREINMSYPYLLICMVSAAAGSRGIMWFYPAIMLFGSLFLFQFRAKRYGLLVWVLLLGVAGISGSAVYTGIIGLEGIIREAVVDFITGETDPAKSITAIGEIGELKLSNRILFRIKTDPKNVPDNGLLLREASYASFMEPRWFAGYGNTLEPLYQEYKKPGEWKLKMYPASTPGSGIIKKDVNVIKTVQENTISSLLETHSQCDTQVISFSRGFKKRKGLLRLPLHTVAIKGLPAELLRQTRLGVVKAERVPNFLNFTVLATLNGNGKSLSSQCPASRQVPATDVDLTIPKGERLIIEGTAQNMGILNSSLSTFEKIDRLKKYFAKNFRYSLIQSGKTRKNKDQSYLQRFLTETKKGHCEFYATATVLLLRSAGIPARYATGYVAAEYSGLEKQYIIRKRHAHAWALAWSGGQWHNVDATPSIWAENEQEMHSSILKKFYDLVSWVKYRFLNWRYANRDKNIVTMLWWFLIPLIGYLIWRLVYKKKVTRINRKKQKQKKKKKSGPDSFTLHKEHFHDYYTKFTQIEAKLKQHGFTRYSWESLREFFARVEQSDQEQHCLNSELLHELSVLHNKLRFDPENVEEGEEGRLVELADEWLSESNTK